MRPRKKLVIAVIVITTALFGFFELHGDAKQANDPSSQTVPIVAVVKVERANLARTDQLTAEMRPYQEVDIHAKVAGYLKTINVDIGDALKQGDVIATLDLPEQREDEAKAEADYNVAKLDYDRIEAIIKKQPGLLAQEDVDKARATYEEAKAAYERTKILSDYATITAPFDGVITKRFADPGALVQAGTASDTQTMPVVHFAQESRLRLDFPVPESIVPLIKDGMPVDIRIQATGEKIKSTVARMSDKVNSVTRTMNVEVDLDNSDMHLKPGMYATAIIALDTAKDVLAAPLQAVVTGNKPNVWVVNAKHIIEERPVTLGLETPDRIEISSGVSEGDMLIYGNRGDLSPGMKVVPKFIGDDGS